MTDRRTAEDCRNFSGVIRFQSRVNPERIFLLDLKTNRSYSYREFDLVVEKTAGFLLSKGVRKGDRVTAIIENSPEYCFFYFASLRIGAIFNPMPYISHRKEIEKNIDLVEPALVLIDQRREKEFAEWKHGPIFIPVDSDRQFEKRIAGMPDTIVPGIEVDTDRPACLYYSSGTTSDPKGVLFSHKNMIANIASVCRGFRFSRENEIHLVFLPLGHTASINYSFLPCAFLGGKILLAENFWDIRNKIWDLIEDHRVTYMETVPTVLYSLLNIYKHKIDQDLSSLRFVGCGSAPLQKSIQLEFENKFGLKVANLYGLSETGPTHIDYPLDPGWNPGSIGVPLDVNEAFIMGERGEELQPGQTGEIVLKGDNVFVGYFKNDKLYRDVVRDGYFYTGDLGCKDKQGIYYFIDRKKDIIIKGGINIIPGEIDEILMQHPAVREGLTIGIPDAVFGEEIRSFVVLKDGMSAPSSAILAHCREHLPKIKIPREVIVVDALPKTHSGKLLRKKMRERSTHQTR
jgi:acyl-CoA synthetase (AMP-forming)/AMP-acid ligase II